MRIMGIDPGLKNTGFGIIDIVKGKPYYIKSGVITTNTSDSLPQRLQDIAKHLIEIINTTTPVIDIVSIEKVFVNINPQSTLLLGQARGAAITACVLNNIQVVEFTALQIKQSVSGFGHADKKQITKAVKIILNLNQDPQKDSADALAAALTYIYNNHQI